MKKQSYKKCPRCEINYIKSTDNYCQVCLAEMRLKGESVEVEDELELCPICGQNFISPEKKMCEDCAKQKGIDLEYDDEPENDESDNQEDLTWSDGELPEDEDVELVPLSELEEDDEEEDIDSEEEDSVKPKAFDDEFEDAFPDDLNDVDDLDDEEEADFDEDD